MTAEEFQEARRWLKYSPDALADEWGVDVSTIHRWERGARKVPPLAAYAIKLMVYNVQNGLHGLQKFKTEGKVK